MGKYFTSKLHQPIINVWNSTINSAICDSSAEPGDSAGFIPSFIDYTTSESYQIFSYIPTAGTQTASYYNLYGNSSSTPWWGWHYKCPSTQDITISNSTTENGNYIPQTSAMSNIFRSNKYSEFGARGGNNLGGASTVTGKDCFMLGGSAKPFFKLKGDDANVLTDVTLVPFKWWLDSAAASSQLILSMDVYNLTSKFFGRYGQSTSSSSTSSDPITAPVRWKKLTGYGANNWWVIPMQASGSVEDSSITLGLPGIGMKPNFRAVANSCNYYPIFKWHVATVNPARTEGTIYVLSSNARNVSDSNGSWSLVRDGYYNEYPYKVPFIYGLGHDMSSLTLAEEERIEGSKGGRGPGNQLYTLLQKNGWNVSSVDYDKSLIAVALEVSCGTYQNLSITKCADDGDYKRAITVYNPNNEYINFYYTKNKCKSTVITNWTSLDPSNANYIQHYALPPYGSDTLYIGDQANWDDKYIGVCFVVKRGSYYKTYYTYISEAVSSNPSNTKSTTTSRPILPQ